jgi:hypothetical protein
MTEKKENIPEQIPQKKIISEARGRYVIIDGAKFYVFEFPINSKIEENYAIVSYMKDEIWKTMENLKKKEEETLEKVQK